MQHEPAVGDCGFPTVVGREIGRYHFEVALQSSACPLGEMRRKYRGHLGGSPGRARGAAHSIPGVEQLKDAVLGDETCSAGDEHGVGHCISPVCAWMCGVVE